MKKSNSGQVVTKAAEPTPSLRNTALHIPLDFDTAVTALSNVRTKKKPVQKTDEKQR